MKATLLTKNRRARGGSPRMSLFPFLAVLICTMGALVLVLFAVMRQARKQAVREAAAKVAKQHDDRKEQREATHWRIGQLREARKKMETELAQMRLYLGHLEDDSRQLDEQCQMLERSRRGVSESATQTRQRRGGTKEELEMLQSQVAESEQRLSATREKVAKRPRAYSIVPYEGPNETHRRPIYIECRADAVVLQPEGIAFREADFSGPLGPGNPLASALRAVREHLLAQGVFDPQRDGEPYPLLLVRPSGIYAYYAALEGVKTWGADFGYELIGEDWPLAFPPADRQLIQAVQPAVAVARRRQQELIAAAPIAYGGHAAPDYPAGPGGGTGRGGGGNGGDGSGFGPRTSGQPSAGRSSSGGSGSPGGVSSGGNAGLPYGANGGSADGRGSVGGVAGGSPGSPGYGGGSPGTPGSGGGSTGAMGPAGGFAQGSPGTPGSGGGSAGAMGSAGGFAQGTMGSSSSSPGGSAGIPSGASGFSAGGVAAEGGRDGARSGSSSGATVVRPEGYVAGQPYEPPSRPAPPSSEGQTGTALRPGEWYPTEREPMVKVKEKEEPDDKKRKPPPKTVDKRGRDWGVRDAAKSAVPITRPIRVECNPDRLVVVYDNGIPGGAVVNLNGDMAKSLDAFIAAVWEHIDAWGIAGKGMYWRPVLAVYVAEGAEQRFAELTRLLEGSGLTVERRR